ncbi:caspase recruitment domain-containing protein 19-like isoform X2 [Embiotoca jacksoni]|uniref:caspase recruitment domain-containing protein 19-like isoform X2 n=1 Tax=Embiotoca jacksoni TaxID=100190 RepID=UPI00370387A5
MCGPERSHVAAQRNADVTGQTQTVIQGKTRKFDTGGAVGPDEEVPRAVLFVSMTDTEGYHEQLQSDAQFLCSDQRMDTELVDRLVLQLNRIYPQILEDKEAHRFRNLSVPTKVRLAELLEHLYGKGEEACHEFYHALHIHAEDIYSRLPTRVRKRELADSKWSNYGAIHQERCVINDKGPMFFLSCLSFVAGIAILYYYGEGETLRCTGGFLHCSAARLSKDAKDVLISYAEVGKQK